MGLLYLYLYLYPTINPLNAELNPICHLLALLGTHHIFHVSGLRVNQGEANLILSHTSFEALTPKYS